MLYLYNTRADSASEFRLGGNSSDGTSFICTPQIGECTNTYYILDNGTHIAIVVEREEGTCYSCVYDMQ